MSYKNINYLECHDFPRIPFVKAYIVVLSPTTPLISFEVERNRLVVVAVKQSDLPVWFNLAIFLSFNTRSNHIVPFRFEDEVDRGFSLFHIFIQMIF